MGVSGLLPLLKSIQRPTELKLLHGETLGVDAYGWLHRAAFSCAGELAQGKPTSKYINAFLHRVRMLRHFGVKPYIVFDGDFLPSKAATEESRAKKRDERRKLAQDLIKAGKPSQAVQEFQKCIDVTPQMACNIMHHLDRMEIPYVVAPYEADAQLVYLERHGFISGILSDDSDLLVFGAKRLFTKLDQYGSCIEISRRNFGACREVSLTGWTDADFRRMAIMSGCDYLGGLPGVGLKTAYRMLRKCKTPERVVRMLQFEGKRISENYLTLFYQAELTFLHQWVFCPTKKELVHLTELEGSRTAEEMPFIGAYVEPDLARAIAKGQVDPISKEPVIVQTTPSKRRHSQTTPSSTLHPSPKPISSYFKGRNRIPMGEMDANCFSVDPQKVAQITERGLVPRVFPLPRPYLDEPERAHRPAQRRMSSDPARAESQSLQRRHQTEPASNTHSRAASSPASAQSVRNGLDSRDAVPQTEPPMRPQKKARLCGEAAEDGSPKNSRFFPPLKRNSPRRTKSDAYLFSDDSIEEALCDLPDLYDWRPASRGGKSITIFSDTSPGKSQASRTGVAPVETRQMRPVNDLPAAPLLPPKSAKPFCQLSETPARSNLSRYVSSMQSSAATPASSVSHRSSVFSVASTPSTAPSTAHSRLTPLQRLGVRATGAAMSPKLPMPRPSIAAGFGKGLPVNPSFVPLPKVDLDEVEALNTLQGSEDQIAPLPGGDEDAEDEAELPLTKLDLSRFAFT